MGLTLPFDPTESVSAARLAWAIERYAAGTITAEEIEATHELSPGVPGADVDSQLRRFQVFRRPIDEVLNCEFEPGRARAVARSGADTVDISVSLGEPPDCRIVSMSLVKRPAPGVTVRLATQDDGPALRDLERRCAVETGGVSVYYDRGDDYFAQQRLMPHHGSSIAEYHGRVVGVSSDAFRDVRIAGVVQRVTYRFHMRIDPAARGLGILPALNTSQSEFLRSSRFPGDASPWGRRPGISHVFIAVENEQMLKAIGPAQSSTHWPTNIERIVLPCSDLAGSRHGRAASPDDAGRIAQFLSASHGEEELAIGFDAAWVTERLSRSPRDYSWKDVMLSERAVLGIWDSGLSIVRMSGSGTRAARTATVLDWGFEPGGEGELEALIRSACAELGALGVDDLAIFSSPPSPGRDLLVGLARSVERFRVGTGGVMPSRDTTCGVYVDPIYF